MIVAFIPVRIGSKSIPFKNVKELNGKPLVQYVIDAAKASQFIDKVVVSLDSKMIEEKIHDAEIFWRSSENATDKASSESALLEYVKNLDDEDIVVFLQATSPLITTNEINEGVKKLLIFKCDSSLSVVRQKRFIWDEEKCKPKNYVLSKRPRRQEMKGYLVENGAFYVSRVKNIKYSKCRISGNIGLVECSSASYIEIDEPLDWLLVETLLKNC
jgi:N-acylneuraminate cytidylyltransferase